MSLGIKSSYSEFYKWYCKTKTDSKHIQDFKDDINEEISTDIPPEERMWADFELGLGQYTTKFTPENAEQYLDCLEDATESIRQYLQSHEEHFEITNYTEQSKKDLANSMVNFYGELSDREKNEIKENIQAIPNENRELSFISFNYTSTLEKVLTVIPDTPIHSWNYSGSTYSYLLNRNIIHVHGTVNEFPILGVNDESQVANEALLNVPQFKELMFKANNVQELGRLWHSQAETQIANSRIVGVLGMSLGASDAKWWRLLVQWLKGSNKRHVILYWFEKDPPNGISSRKQLRSVNNAKERLLSYSKLTEEETSILKQRIHVVINTKQFLHLDKTEEYERQLENQKKQGSLSEERIAEYEHIRRDIAEALTMYACNYGNPLDIAKLPEQKLPDTYREGSKKLRELAAKLSAFCETSSAEELENAFPAQDLKEAARNLIGLSNSFTTPYNMPDNNLDRRNRRDMEAIIREALQLRELASL